jgi:hypothetical protein
MGVDFRRFSAASAPSSRASNRIRTSSQFIPILPSPQPAEQLLEPVAGPGQRDITVPTGTSATSAISL